MHVTVCICTYRRTDMLRRLLTDVASQDSHGQFEFSVVVVDNDPERSAEVVTAECASASAIKMKYDTEPQRNIALVRNKTLQNAQGDAIAFIDDDEFPVKDWLFNLVKTSRELNVAGVLGPVRPDFPAAAPAWVRRGGFYHRPEHETGYLMPWPECRTGNVLLLRRIFAKDAPAFDPNFPSGGEDVDFFRRMTEAGHKFVWCNEAVAYETVPPDRWKRSILFKRALQRGANSLRNPRGRIKGVIKACLAVPLYVLALPFLQLAGHHLFMKYAVKLCDHAGRLMACLGIQPLRERQM